MAKGIVISRPVGAGGSATGMIRVTDGSGTDTAGSGVGSVGSPTTAVVTPSATITVGSTVQFSEGTNSNVGDLVSFNVGPDGQATGIATQKAGRLLTGTIEDTIVVGSGESVLVMDANVDGKITVNGGFLVIDSTSMEGKIESTVANSYVIIGNNTKVEGKVEVTGASYLIIQGGTVEGKISSTGNVYASVTGCTVKGKLEVLNATTCKCSGNNVEGKTNTPGCTA